jgi:hypothetical protein
MEKVLLSLSLAVGLATNLAAAEPKAAPPALESIEWCDIWISHANETNLPRVLLLGDSIPVLLKEIESVLDGTKFDVIHFNNGMHGWQHSEAEYRKAFPKLIKTIRSHAPKAKLIWATTTPLRDGTGATHDPKAEYSDERIAARNAVAAEMVAAQHIPIDDLNAAVRGHPEYHSDNVHFNGEGIQIQAAQVSVEVEKLLPR